MDDLAEINGVLWNTKNVSEFLVSDLKLEEPASFTLPSFLDKYREIPMQLTKKVNTVDMVWDFVEYDKFRGKKFMYIYRFDQVKSTPFRLLLKRLVLREWFENRSDPPSVYIAFRDVVKFISYLEDRFVTNPAIISTHLLKEYWKVEKKRPSKKTGKSVTEKTKARTLGNLRKFLVEVDYVENIFKENDFDEIIYDRDKRKIKSQIESGKTPNIPRQFFNKIIQLALDDISRYEVEIRITEFCKILSLHSGTIYTYSQSLEELGYSFVKGTNNARIYTKKDIAVFQEFKKQMKLSKKRNYMKIAATLAFQYSKELDKSETTNLQQPPLSLNTIMVNDISRYEVEVRTTELCNILSLDRGTIYRYSQSLEELGYSFMKGKINARIYTKKDIAVFQEFKKQIERNRIKIAASLAFQYSKKLEESETFTVHQAPLSLDAIMDACMILLFSQIGMRLGEARILQTNKLREIAVSKDKSYTVLDFWTYKTTGSEGRWTVTRMNEIAVLAYKTLQSIGTQRRVNGSTVLYPNKKGMQYNEKSLSRRLRYFFIRHQHNLGIEELTSEELKQLTKSEINEFDVKEFPLTQKDIGRVYYRARSHQFRVAVANELRDKGVGLHWIKTHMNHLEEEMTEHYFRENIQLAVKTLQARASKEGLLEMDPTNIKDNQIRKELDDPYFKKAYEDINSFLKIKRMNIHKNIDEILDVLKDTPVREQELGFCYNALSLLCERQNQLTTLESWYIARPQVLNIVNLPLTYLRFEDKVKTVRHNEQVASKQERFQRQYELDLKSLIALCRQKLYPELQLLRKEIEKKGTEYVIHMHPKLEEIVRKLDKIESECIEWIPETILAN